MDKQLQGKIALAVGGAALVFASLAQAQQGGDVAVAQQLMERHFEIWNDNDASHWAAKFPQVYTTDVLMADYGGAATGYTGIKPLIERVQAEHAGFRFTPGAVALNHGLGRITWSFGPKEHPDQIQGEDIFTIRDGRLASLHVFINKK